MNRQQGNMRRSLLVCVVLSVVTLAVFWPVVHNEFVNYDDNCYIFQNPQVQAGLTWRSLVWAFGRLHGDATYWHPLTWVSHMLDCQLFGLKPAGHHLVNVFFHALNSVLVFVVFQRLTRAFWRSALLAALFALHPLQVDTVAWVAERKNLLSAFFFLLTLWAYSRYAECGMRNAECGVKKSGAGITPHGSRLTHYPSRFTLHASRSYLLSLFFFILGLMCKPVLVTLPFVLLLLDYWPLGRMQNAESDLTQHATRNTQQATRNTGQSPIANRKWQMLLPLLLEKLPFFALSAVSCWITVAANRAVGAMADAAVGFLPELRLQNALFSYVKYLGKALWPVHLAVFYPYPEQFPLWRAVTCALLLLAISGLALAAARRLPYFPVGWFWFLGVLVPFAGLIQAGEQAMADRFTYVPLIGLFLLLVWAAEALTRGRRWGRLLLTAAAATVLVFCTTLSRRQTGYWQSSVTLFTHSLAVTGDNARAHANLGMAFAAEGKTEAAIENFLECLRLNPEHAIGHWAVGVCLEQQGRFDEAVQHYETALSLKPDFPEALNNLAWLRATHPDPKYRNGAAAVELAERACRLTEQQEPFFLGTLAAAYAEAGRFDDAIKTAEQARTLAARVGQKENADKNRQLLELYRAGKPYHEPAPAAPGPASSSK